MIDRELQIRVLYRDGYHAAAKLLEQDAMKPNAEAEMAYMQLFAKEAYFENEVERKQLRCLWTAYCCHQDIDVDTLRYDIDLEKVYGATLEAADETPDWKNIDEFDSFMVKHLV